MLRRRRRMAIGGGAVLVVAVGVAVAILVGPLGLDLFLRHRAGRRADVGDAALGVHGKLARLLLPAARDAARLRGPGHPLERALPRRVDAVQRPAADRTHRSCRGRRGSPRDPLGLGRADAAALERPAHWSTPSSGRRSPASTTRCCEPASGRSRSPTARPSGRGKAAGTVPASARPPTARSAPIRRAAATCPIGAPSSQALMRRFPQMVALEVWNEPNLPRFFAPRPSPALYSRLRQDRPRGGRRQRRARPRSSPPVSRSGASAVKGGIGAPSFLTAVYRKAGAASFDGIGAHPYPHGPPRAANMTANLNRLRRVRDRFGDRATPLWVTEVGVGGTSGRRGKLSVRLGSPGPRPGPHVPIDPNSGRAGVHHLRASRHRRRGPEVRAVRRRAGQPPAEARLLLSRRAARRGASVRRRGLIAARCERRPARRVQPGWRPTCGRGSTACWKVGRFTQGILGWVIAPTALKPILSWAACDLTAVDLGVRVVLERVAQRVEQRAAAGAELALPAVDARVAAP